MRIWTFRYSFVQIPHIARLLVSPWIWKIIESNNKTAWFYMYSTASSEKITIRSWWDVSWFGTFIICGRFITECESKKLCILVLPTLLRIPKTVFSVFGRALSPSPFSADPFSIKEQNEYQLWHMLLLASFFGDLVPSLRTKHSVLDRKSSQ